MVQVVHMVKMIKMVKTKTKKRKRKHNVAIHLVLVSVNMPDVIEIVVHYAVQVHVAQLASDFEFDFHVPVPGVALVVALTSLPVPFRHS